MAQTKGIIVTQDQEYACEKCTFVQSNGMVCALHGVEVERRKSTSEMVAKLERTTNALTKFMWTMVGISFLGSLVLAGSYTYTSNVERTLGARQDVARGKIEALHGDVTTTKMSIAVTEDRYLRIYQQLDKISDSIEKLTEKQKQVDGWGPK